MSVFKSFSLKMVGMTMFRSLVAIFLIQLMFWPIQASAFIVSAGGSSARIDYDFTNSSGNLGIAFAPFKYSWVASFGGPNFGTVSDWDVGERFKLTVFDADHPESHGEQTVENLFGASISGVSSSIQISDGHQFLGSGQKGFLLFEVLVGSHALNLFTVRACKSSCSVSTGFAAVTITEIPAVIPLPAALPLYGTGLAVMGFLGWRRKRQALRD